MLTDKLEKRTNPADENWEDTVVTMSSQEASPSITKQAVYNHARDIFGEPKKVFSWMNTPNRIFSGMRPKDFIECASLEDLKSVMEELDRIDQGLF